MNRFVDIVEVTENESNEKMITYFGSTEPTELIFYKAKPVSFDIAVIAGVFGYVAVLYVLINVS